MAVISKLYGSEANGPVTFPMPLNSDRDLGWNPGGKIDSDLSDSLRAPRLHDELTVSRRAGPSALFSTHVCPWKVFSKRELSYFYLKRTIDFRHDKSSTV